MTEPRLAIILIQQADRYSRLARFLTTQPELLYSHYISPNRNHVSKNSMPYAPSFCLAGISNTGRLCMKNPITVVLPQEGRVMHVNNKEIERE